MPVDHPDLVALVDERGAAKDELRLRRCQAFGDGASEIDDNIDYYNNWRPQAGLGKMTPAEFRDYLLARPIRLPVPLAAARENGTPRSGFPFLSRSRFS